MNDRVLPEPEPDVQVAVAQEVERLLANDAQLSHGSMYHDIIRVVDMAILDVLMEHTRYHQTRAAKILGVSRNTLRTKLELYFGDRYIRKNATACGEKETDKVSSGV